MCYNNIQFIKTYCCYGKFLEEGLWIHKIKSKLQSLKSLSKKILLKLIQIIFTKKSVF